MKLRFSRRATRRIEEIAVFIRRHNPEAADTVRDAILGSCSRIAAYPHVDREVGLGIRRLVVPRLPYLIFYKVDPPSEQVSIVTIRHTAGRPLKVRDIS